MYPVLLGLYTAGFICGLANIGDPNAEVGRTVVSRETDTPAQCFAKEFGWAPVTFLTTIFGTGVSLGQGIIQPFRRL